MKLRYSFILLLILSARLFCDEDPETRGANPLLSLESPVLEFVDGKPGLGIDGQIYGMIMKLRMEFNRLRLGIKNADGSHTGYYTFQGKKYTAAQLAELEDQGVNLKDLLASSKEDFHKKISPLIQIGRGAKQHMVILIQEWATKAKRLQSHLLDWAHTPEGGERNSLEVNITSFKKFDQFLNDLVYFLETMLRSCPKAYKQFKDLVDQKLQEQQHRP